MFRRLKNLNKTNKYITEILFKGFLLILTAYIITIFIPMLSGDRGRARSYFVQDMKDITCIVFLILGGLFFCVCFLRESEKKLLSAEKFISENYSQGKYGRTGLILRAVGEGMIFLFTVSYMYF